MREGIKYFFKVAAIKVAAISARRTGNQDENLEDHAEDESIGDANEHGSASSRENGDQRSDDDIDRNTSAGEELVSASSSENGDERSEDDMYRNASGSGERLASLSNLAERASSTDGVGEVGDVSNLGACGDSSSGTASSIYYDSSDLSVGNSAAADTSGGIEREQALGEVVLSGVDGDLEGSLEGGVLLNPTNVISPDKWSMIPGSVVQSPTTVSAARQVLVITGRPGQASAAQPALGPVAPQCRRSILQPPTYSMEQTFPVASTAASLNSSLLRAFGHSLLLRPGQTKGQNCNSGRSTPTNPTSTEATYSPTSVLHPVRKGADVPRSFGESSSPRSHQ